MPILTRIRMPYISLALIMLIAGIIASSLALPAAAYAASQTDSYAVPQNAPFAAHSGSILGSQDELVGFDNCTYPYGNEPVKGTGVRPKDLELATKNYYSVFEDAATAEKNSDGDWGFIPEKEGGGVKPAEYKKRLLKEFNSKYNGLSSEAKHLWDDKQLKKGNYLQVMEKTFKVCPANVYLNNELNDFKQLIMNTRDYLGELVMSIPTDWAVFAYQKAAPYGFRFGFFTPHVERGETMFDIQNCDSGDSASSTTECGQMLANGYSNDRAAPTGQKQVEATSYIKAALALRYLITATFAFMVLVGGFIYMFNGHMAKRFNIVSIIPRMIVGVLMLFLIPTLLGAAISLSNIVTVAMVEGGACSAASSISCNASNNMNIILSKLGLLQGDTSANIFAEVIATQIPGGAFVASYWGGGGAVGAGFGLIRLVVFSAAAFYMFLFAFFALMRNLLLVGLIVALPVAVWSFIFDGRKALFRRWMSLTGFCIAMPAITGITLSVTMGVNPILMTDTPGTGTILLGALWMFVVFYLLGKMFSMWWAIARGKSAATQGAIGKATGSMGKLLQSTGNPYAMAAGSGMRGLSSMDKNATERLASYTPNRGAGSTTPGLISRSATSAAGSIGRSVAPQATAQIAQHGVGAVAGQMIGQRILKNDKADANRATGGASAGGSGKPGRLDRLITAKPATEAKQQWLRDTSNGALTNAILAQPNFAQWASVRTGADGNPQIKITNPSLAPENINLMAEGLIPVREEGSGGSGGLSSPAAAPDTSGVSSSAQAALESALAGMGKAAGESGRGANLAAAAASSVDSGRADILTERAQTASSSPANAPRRSLAAAASASAEAGRAPDAAATRSSGMTAAAGLSAASAAEARAAAAAKQGGMTRENNGSQAGLASEALNAMGSNRTSAQASPLKQPPPKAKK